VSQIRNAVSRLLAEGLALNEIAHRLGVANSTVGYHVQALREQREQREKGVMAAERTPGRTPVAAPSVTRERVRRLLDQGYTRAKIAETLGLARSTVTYHATRLERRSTLVAHDDTTGGPSVSSTKKATASKTAAPTSASASSRGTTPSGEG
jgi:DNA-binding NarL/FixJ family response regulator